MIIKSVIVQRRKSLVIVHIISAFKNSSSIFLKDVIKCELFEECSIEILLSIFLSCNVCTEVFW